MIRKLFFCCVLVPTVLALPAAPLLAAPVGAQVGADTLPATLSGVFGIVNASVPVRQSTQMSPAANPSAAMPATSAPPGDASAWRNATLALIAVLIIGALALRRQRSPATVAMAIVAGVIIVAIAYAQSRAGSSSMDGSSMQAAQGSAPIPVTLATVEHNRSGPSIAAPANVTPYLVQGIAVRVPGLLSDFDAYTGDRLSAGEVVARLDEPELQSNAQAARSGARAAQDDIDIARHQAMIARADLASKQQQLVYWKAEIARERWLLGQGAVSVQDYQNETAQASAAQSAYDAARAKVAGANVGVQAAQALASQAASNAQAQSTTAGYTSVIVPDDAIVMRRLVDPGVYVQQGTPILQVAVIDRLRVQAQVAQQDLAGVHVGTPIDVTFSDGTVLHSRVSSVSPVVDPNTHTAIAETIVANPGDRYQPGAFAHAVLHPQAGAPSRSYTVPSGAIVGGATAAIWVDLNGTAHRVPVTVVSDDGTTAQVTGDLHAGTRVVVTGAANLEEGNAIAVSPL